MKRKIKWKNKYVQVNLDPELYPDDLIQDTFFILTKQEIKELVDKTIKRIKSYNKNYRPKGHATYGGYGVK